MPGEIVKLRVRQYDMLVDRENIYLFLSEHTIDFGLRIFNKTIKYGNPVLQTPDNPISQSIIFYI